MPRPSCLLLTSLLMLAAPAAGALDAGGESVRLAEAPARLVLPPRGRAAPLVILLPDATGEQGRASPYAKALAARGVASLVLGLEDGEGPAPRPTGAGEIDEARRWARGMAPLLDGRRFATVGIGAGARAALAVEDGPLVLLDPGCAGLRLPAGREVLLVHGLAAPDAAACRVLARRSGATLLSMPGIGHGWDLPVVAAPAGALLPDPAGPGRRRATPDPIAAEAAAAQIADWLAAHFAGWRP